MAVHLYDRLDVIGLGLKRNNLKLLKDTITAHDSWELVDSDDDDNGNPNTFFVVKNTAGLLNYDPHIAFRSNDDDGNAVKVFPMRSYDSDKELDDQEGSIRNGDAVYEFKLNYNKGRFHLSIRGLIVTDYNINIPYSFFTSAGNMNYDYAGEFIFQIIDSVDKDTGGMYLYNTNHGDGAYSYLHQDDIWYGQDKDSLWGANFKVDNDKSVGFRHYPSPSGSISASPKAFFINKTDDTSVNLWAYAGITKELYARNNTETTQTGGYLEGNIWFYIYATQIPLLGYLSNLNIDGENKLCRIVYNNLVINDEDTEFKDYFAVLEDGN